MKKTLLALVALTVLAACSKKDSVSFDTLETNRANAKENASYNAQKYRADSQQFANYAIEASGDSTQSSDCGQGDGWASVKLISKEDPKLKLGLKCSTVSSTIGCMLESDFSKKAYASEDGICQPITKVPFPIPKIAK